MRSKPIWTRSACRVKKMRLRPPPVVNVNCETVLNMIRFLNRDPTGFCNSEMDRDRTGF